MLLAIDKPTGITSYDVIRVLKRHLPRKIKIGHAGTLDPEASGLMLIGVGKDTKRLHELTGLSKTYETTIDFAKMSDTRDMQPRKDFEEYEVSDNASMQGVTIAGKFRPAPQLGEIQALLDKLVPEAELPLTPFSAKKVDGKKLYEYAREGSPIFMDIMMKTNNVKIIDYAFPELKLELDVGKGTYIRSIGYWIGRELNVGGILTSLRRTVVGDYALKDFQFNELEKIPYAIIENNDNISLS